MDSLEALQGLYRDLVLFSERRLPLVERLATELQDRLEDFRSLLQKKPRSASSRTAVQSGKLNDFAFF
jgi:nuclear pore complex protein Nup205